MNDPRNEQFLSLLLSHQRRIYGFILTLVPNLSDADDIMQETALVMCRKFSDFKPGTSFIAWSLTIARYQVMMFRRKQKATGSTFDDTTLMSLAEQIAVRINDMDDRTIALEKCIRRLNDKDRELIKIRYEEGTRINEIARKIGRSEEGLYKTFARIHNYLRLCVLHTMGALGV